MTLAVRHRRSFLAFLSLTIISALYSAPLYAQGVTYDAAADFSGASNPNGPWAYGWSQNLFGVFIPSTNSRIIAGGLINWPGAADQFGTPDVSNNPTASTLQTSSTIFGPGDVALYPGPSGQMAVLRWIAPVNGNFTIDVNFYSQPQFAGAATTDVHLLHNGVSLFDGVINGAGQNVGISLALQIVAGDVLDVRVGNGLNGNYNSDSTGVDFIINEILAPPPPADLDGDGLTDELEAELGTDPMNSDTDGDGIDDPTEAEAFQAFGCPSPLTADSDGDTLSDGDEVQAGIDPCSTDSDGDSIPDPIDPFPGDPNGTAQYIADGFSALSLLVNELSLGSFDGRTAGAKTARRQVLGMHLSDASSAISDGDFTAATEAINSVLNRIDGDPSPPDWIVSESDAASIEASIQELLALIEYIKPQEEPQSEGWHHGDREHERQGRDWEDDDRDGRDDDRGRDDHDSDHGSRCH